MRRLALAFALAALPAAAAPATSPATWTPKHDAPRGAHRFVVTAKRQRLVSAPFEVR